MTIFSVIALAVSFVLALFCSWAILLPFFSVEESPLTDTADRRQELRAKEDNVLRALEDVEQDFRVGKLAEADYHDEKVELTAQAGAVLTELDSLDRPGDALADTPGAAKFRTIQNR